MPEYKNPPILEAICEVQFLPLDDREWDLTLPGELKLDPRLKEYDGPSRQQHRQSIAAAAVSGSPEITIHNALFRVQLPRMDNSALVAVGHNVISVHVMKPYEGWKSFQPRIMNALAVFIEKSNQLSAQRVGLRYINRIASHSHAPRNASNLLNGIATTIKPLANKRKADGWLTAMNARHEYEFPNRIKAYVTHATLNPSAPDMHEYLLDIDTVWDSEPLNGLAQISNKLEELHSLEGSVFESLITDASREIFNDTDNRN